MTDKQSQCIEVMLMAPSAYKYRLQSMTVLNKIAQGVTIPLILNDPVIAPIKLERSRPKICTVETFSVLSTGDNEAKDG